MSLNELLNKQLSNILNYCLYINTGRPSVGEFCKRKWNIQQYVHCHVCCNYNMRGSV